MGTTKIEWADAVWNPVTGCTKVSAGCANCYAERMAKRFPQIHGLDFMPAYPDYIGPTDADPVPFSQVVCHPDRLDQPLHWLKPRRVFVCSMGDLFHEDVPDDFRDKVFAVSAFCSRHTMMFLTKRPAAARSYIDGLSKKFARLRYAGLSLGLGLEFKGLPLVPWPIRNLWLGVSVENQETADERIPLLLQTPAAARFVSVEPMLGPVDLRRAFGTGGPRQTFVEQLDWVICGGETGPGARPMHPDWSRSLRDQCQAAGVPFFFKQWGEWQPSSDVDITHKLMSQNMSGSKRIITLPSGLGAAAMLRVGKKAAGRLLDGSEWNEYPPCGHPCKGACGSQVCHDEYADFLSGRE